MTMFPTLLTLKAMAIVTVKKQVGDMWPSRIITDYHKKTFSLVKYI